MAEWKRFEMPWTAVVQVAGEKRMGMRGPGGSADRLAGFIGGNAGVCAG